MTTRYVIQRIALGPVAKFGLALGILGSVLPACATAYLSRQALTFLLRTLEAATQAKISLLGQNLSVNLVDLLHLMPALQTLRALDALGWLLPAGILVACTLIEGIFITATVLLVAAGFNLLAALTGGLEFQALERGPRT